MKPTIEEVRAWLRTHCGPYADAAIAALDVAEACVDWVDDGELCHTCGADATTRSECMTTNAR